MVRYFHDWMQTGGGFGCRHCPLRVSAFELANLTRGHRFPPCVKADARVVAVNQAQLQADRFIVDNAAQLRVEEGEPSEQTSPPKKEQPK